MNHKVQQTVIFGQDETIDDSPRSEREINVDELVMRVDDEWENSDQVSC